MSDMVKLSKSDRDYLDSIVSRDISEGTVDTSAMEFRRLLKDLPPLKDYKDEDE